MATLTNIDRRRAVTFTAHTTTDKLPDGMPDWLPSQLTRAVAGEIIEISPARDGQSHFLDWLAESGWVAKVERDLQCLSETNKGEPLLTSWMKLDEFAALAADAAVASMMPSMEEAIARWRELGVTDVFFDGYKAVGNI
jgi:hypothetical protein